MASLLFSVSVPASFVHLYVYRARKRRSTDTGQRSLSCYNGFTRHLAWRANGSRIPNGRRMIDKADTILVGIISDTHGRLTNAALVAFAECDRIIHAGDIGLPGILHSLEALAPVTAVLGNNDFDEYGSRVQRFAHLVIGGVRFLVAHYPSDVRIGWNGGPGIAPGDPIPQVCVHGHTHIPEIVAGKDARPADYIVCPGSVTFPRGGSFPSVAKLEIAGGRVARVWIEEIE